MRSTVLLHGAGALGTVYIYLLLNAGCEVTAVCRSNYSAVKQNSFTIDSSKYGKNINVRPKVVQSPGEAASNGQTFDYVIVSTKALPDTHTAELIKLAITAGKTCIVLIQNGIGIEHEYYDLFPDNPLLSCVAYLPTTQIQPGHVEMAEVESLEIGAFPASTYETDSNTREAADRFVDI